MVTSLRVLVISGLMVAVCAAPGLAAGTQDWRDDYWSGRQMRAEIRQQVRDALREARSAMREARRGASREAWHTRREALREAHRIRREVHRSLDRYHWHGYGHEHWRD